MRMLRSVSTSAEHHSFCESLFFRGRSARTARELDFDPLSLRRYYPDQVQRVDGGSKAILSAGSFPSSPVQDTERFWTLFKMCRIESQLLSCSFLEEISRPLRPTRVLRSRAEVQFQLHPDLEGFKPRCSNDARQSDFFRHLYDSDRIWGHVIKQGRSHVNDSIRDEFSL